MCWFDEYELHAVVEGADRDFRPTSFQVICDDIVERGGQGKYLSIIFVCLTLIDKRPFYTSCSPFQIYTCISHQFLHHLGFEPLAGIKKLTLYLQAFTELIQQFLQIDIYQFFTALFFFYLR